MTQTVQTALKSIVHKPKLSIKAIFHELMILNEAYAELQRLRRLDTETLRDMGLPASARENTNLHEIAARIRAHRSA